MPSGQARPNLSRLAGMSAQNDFTFARTVQMRRMTGLVKLRCGAQPNDEGPERAVHVSNGDCVSQLYSVCSLRTAAVQVHRRPRMTEENYQVTAVCASRTTASGSFCGFSCFSVACIAFSIVISCSLSPGPRLRGWPFVPHRTTRPGRDLRLSEQPNAHAGGCSGPCWSWSRSHHGRRLGQVPGI